MKDGTNTIPLRWALLGRALLGVSVVAALALPAASAGQAPVPPQQPLQVAFEGAFEEKPGKPAEDLSGIACRSLDGATFRCLVVNDESSFAQWATYSRGRLVAGKTLRLIGATPPGLGDAAGAMPPVGTCPGDVVAAFKEFDGEGVAWVPGPGAGGSFFVVGSHACGRHPPLRMRHSTHLLARIEAMEAAGGPTGKVALTWRLGPSLRAASDLGAFYNQALTREAQGLDIEGIAAVGGELFFGLRAPSLDGHAFILRATAAALFDAAAPADRPVPLGVARLPLGPGTGIRDLAALPDGRLLVLSGPAQDQPAVPFALQVATPGNEALWRTEPLLQIKPTPGHPGAKAEGVAVLGVDGGMLHVLVLYEKPLEGGAQDYSLPLSPR